MTQYIKHYYKKTIDDTWITSIKKTYNSDTNEWYISPSDLQDGSWRDRTTSVVKRYNPFKQWFS